MFYRSRGKERFFPIIAVMVIVFVGALGIAGQNGFASEEEMERSIAAAGSFTALAKKASPAVVNISTTQTVETNGQRLPHFFRRPGQQQQQETPMEEFFERFFGRQDPRQFQRQSLGSGFILDEKGYIVTNNHVIENADEIKVTLQNGKDYDAEIIGADPGTDIALIKIEAETGLPLLELGDSESLEIGQWVLAIGNPFGLDHTVTAGIVSAKGRVIGAGAYDDFIQTDASINPGNSGGPLIDMEGNVVGINTAIVAGGDGIGFAIPISMAERIIEQLKETGEVTRGWLGVGIQELDSDLKDYYNVDEGALITEVFPDEPADQAGIQKGDIIIAVNGEAVDSPRALSRKIANIKPGTDIELRIVRDGKKETITATVEQRDEARLGAKTPRSQQKEQAADALGLELTNIDQETAERLNLDDTHGVIVSGVAPDTKAASAGFARGDIIKEINRKPVRTIEDYERIVADADEGDMLLFYIIRLRAGIKILRIEK